ncbi:MAG TPA: SET domain-containing protein [Rhizomicrobium sp.]|jgi:hypothetical protein|nr:SET domain-containing protein [Rhizomicrobium sp.]
MARYRKRTWVGEKLAPGPSRIHGEGVVATAPIRRGETLMIFGGLAVPAAGIDLELYRIRSIWKVENNLYLALPQSDPAPSLDENLNHSCEANAWLDDAVTLSAARDIGPGEEITLDQGAWNFEDEDYLVDGGRCRCGATSCRGVLTARDWTLPAVRLRYRGHFHPLIAAMIALETERTSARKRRAAKG